MTYNSPELLLVGAAQNLVLATSPQSETKLDANPERCEIEEDVVSESYFAKPSW
jgi:hypothetical protein